MQKRKILSREEEIELFSNYKSGDMKAKETLITSNLGFIYHLAKKYPSNYKEDLIQEGVFGLMDAIEKYDQSYNVRFITFAYWDIKKYFSEFFKNNNSNHISLNTKVGENNDSELIDIISKEYSNTFQNTLTSTIKNDILNNLDSLVDYEKIIVREMLNNKTLDEISDDNNWRKELTKSRYSKLKRKLHKSLRHLSDYVK